MWFISDTVLKHCNVELIHAKEEDETGKKRHNEDVKIVKGLGVAESLIMYLLPCLANGKTFEWMNEWINAWCSHIVDGTVTWYNLIEGQFGNIY